MWILDLNCKEDENTCSIAKIIALISGVYNIQVPESLVSESEQENF